MSKPDEQGDVRDGPRRKAIVGGETDKLKSIVCSEFTALTLQKMGIDLKQRYADPATGLPVGWLDGKGFALPLLARPPVGPSKWRHS